MCGAIVFLPRFRFSLGMQTLIPWGVVQYVQLLLSTTLLFLPCCPSHPSLTEAAVSLPSHHCRGSTGFSNAGMSSLCSDTRLQCLGKSCHRVAGTGMWERPGQPMPVFGTGRQSESAGQLSALCMPLGCQRNGRCRQVGMGRVAQKCRPHLEQDVLRFPLLLEAVTVCDSALTVLLISLSTRTPSAGTWGCTAWSSSYLCSGAWRAGELPVLMKWVTFQVRLLLPNWGAWCCSDVTLPSLQSSRISREETNLL